MGKLKVELKATLEGVTDLRPKDGYLWHFKLKCTKCQEEHKNWVSVDPTEKNAISGSRGEANLVWRCSFCGKENTLDFDSSFKPASYSLDDSETHKLVAFAVMDCRGLEVIDWDHQGEWQAKGAESGTRFDEIELSKEETDGWTDYDEKAGEPVGVTEVETRISRA